MMNNTFHVHHLHFQLEALTPLAIDPPAGPKLRAALYNAMGMVCPLKGDANAPPEHKAACPVCWLLATEKPGDRGGKDLPRPVAIEPPLHRLELAPGQHFSFGLSIFARAANLFPYLALGVPEMGRRGVGRKMAALDYRRGQFKLARVLAYNPLTGQSQLLLDAAEGPLFQTPALPVTADHVQQKTQDLLGRDSDPVSVGIHFLTPTRLVTGSRLSHVPHFPVLFGRLADRLEALDRHYADGALIHREDKPQLMALAEGVQLESDHGKWLEAHSYSSRQKKLTPISGFVGRVTYRAPAGHWRKLLLLLLWGQSIHVGKSATRGDGWYRLEVDTHGNR
ncbi:MAG: CRISPR system precrRNA processing endoribonuclease RAMP protein Cas6 [Anaerolineales bacterium]|nr:CRISPR system precrRNA processing endoribonuclease RAMP protein Cas6 [Anaerolineales bacterium]